MPIEASAFLTPGPSGERSEGIRAVWSIIEEGIIPNYLYLGFRHVSDSFGNFCVESGEANRPSGVVSGSKGMACGLPCMAFLLHAVRDNIVDGLRA